MSQRRPTYHPYITLRQRINQTMDLLPGKAHYCPSPPFKRQVSGQRQWCRNHHRHGPRGPYVVLGTGIDLGSPMPDVDEAPYIEMKPLLWQFLVTAAPAPTESRTIQSGLVSAWSRPFTATSSSATPARPRGGAAALCRSPQSRPSRLPLIGPVDEVPGLFLCGAHGSYGITLSSVSGKLVADMIVTGTAMPHSRRPHHRRRNRAPARPHRPAVGPAPRTPRRARAA